MAVDTDGQIIDTGKDYLLPGSNWQPVVGVEAQAVINRIEDPTGRVQLTRESLRILSRCVPPSDPSHSDTGLVVGYVQSGKTMSFTTLAALARDNKYRMVIVIAGASIPLFEQSVVRLKEDLDVYRERGRWKVFQNPTRNARADIQAAIDEWDDPTTPNSERATCLLVVMKHHTHLRKLSELLEKLRLATVPVLIIDDEADQASLNALVLSGSESTTYRRILQMRRLIPHHTFLQYTATPQAPLLINIIDTLSPSFAEVITPGASYSGGEDFFLNHPSLIVGVPLAECPTRTYVPSELPDSLNDALCLFYLGVAVAQLRGQNTKGNRSMMIHPSKETRIHAHYLRWVEGVKATWPQTLLLPSSDLDRQELIDTFRASYDVLTSTVADLPPFEDLISQLGRAISRTRVHNFNATHGRTPQVDWKADYSHILVGGQAMDRGFTVEGLTVTYMPRDLGVGNADTVQQRARFYGYKAEYLGFCRVFLHPSVHTALQFYLEHEHDFRERLRRHAGTGMPLSDWRRAFFLDPSLRPTRDNVLDVNYLRVNVNPWFRHRAPHRNPESVSRNWELVRDLLGRIKFPGRHPGDRRVDDHPVLMAGGLNLRMVYRDFLAELAMVDPVDRVEFTGVLLEISRFLDSYPDARCAVLHMDSGQPRKRVLTDDAITLFQGPNPADGSVYAGDAQLIDPGLVTIQVHIVEPTAAGVQMDRRAVPAVAVWVPEGVRRPAVSQDQGNFIS